MRGVIGEIKFAHFFVACLADTTRAVETAVSQVVPPDRKVPSRRHGDISSRPHVRFCTLSGKTSCPLTTQLLQERINLALCPGAEGPTQYLTDTCASRNNQCTLLREHLVQHTQESWSDSWPDREVKSAAAEVRI